MTNFDEFAATVLEIYSIKNWGSDCPELSNAISTLTGAKCARIMLTRESCWKDCASRHGGRVEPAPCTHPVPGHGNSRADGRMTFCTPIEETMSDDGLRLRIDLDFLSPEHAHAENGRRLLMALLPHFRRAMQRDRPHDKVAQNGGQNPAIISGLLDTFTGQLAVIGGRGTLIDCNSAFSQLLRKEEPVIVDGSGQLSFAAFADQQTFEAALSSNKPTVFFTQGEGSDPMIVTVYPMHQAEEGAKATLMTSGRDADMPWLVWLRPKQPEAISLQFLQPLFGLTRAETRVTEYVVQGLTLDEAAGKIGVSRITARNQLTSAMSKLGVNRQAQLVTLILNMFPRLR